MTQALQKVLENQDFRTEISAYGLKTGPKV